MTVTACMNSNYFVSVRQKQRVKEDGFPRETGVT